MKKIIFGGALLISAFLVQSCGDASENIDAADVPAAVMTSFNTRFPNATNVEWERETRGDKVVYEADFDLNGADTKAEFDANGALIESKGD